LPDLIPDNAEPGAAAPPVPADGYAIRLYPLDEAEEVRLIDLWRVIWQGKWLILALSVLCSLATLVAAYVLTPVYRAQVVMAPESGENSNGGLAGIAGQLGGIAALAGINLSTTEDNSVQALAILRSRAFTQGFIQQHDLLPVLFADLWDPHAKAWDVDDPAETPTLWRAYDLFDKSVRTIFQDAETGLVTLTIDWDDPAKATEWANAMVRELNANVRSRAVDQARKNIDFLREQLNSTSEVELRTVVFGLMEAEMKNAMLANARAEYAFEVIDPAVVPEKRLWPNKLLLAVVGLAAGFLIGVVVVFVRRAFAEAASQSG